MDPVENGDSASAGVGVMMMMAITVLMTEIQSESKKKTVGRQRQEEDNLALKLRTRFQETNNRPTLLLKIHWDEEPFLGFLFPSFKKLIQKDFVVEIYKTRGAALLLRWSACSPL